MIFIVDIEKPMTQFEMYSLILGLITIAVSAGSYLYAKRANRMASEANERANEANEIARKANEISLKSIETSVRIAQRQGVVDLSKSWENTNRLADPVIIPRLVKGANALSDTAAAWNHDIIDRMIIYQQYYDSFCHFYEFIEAKRDQIVPELHRTYKSMIDGEVERAYQEMKALHLSRVTQTKML
jgi:hypothetical protein